MVSKLTDAALKKLDLPNKLPTKVASEEDKAQGNYVEYGTKGDKFELNAKGNYDSSWSGSKSGSTEFEVDAKTQKKLEESAAKLGKIQQGLESLGIKPELKKDFESTWGKQADYHSSGKTKGKYGEAEYEIDANAQIMAGMAGQASISMNGIDANFQAKIGMEATVQMSGKASTSFNVGGVEVPASVEAKLKATAKATAEANGTVKVTRDPLTAVAEGSVGASAVVKVEGEVTASAGPFSVKAKGYVSAGAEAQASGKIGFEDGKLKLSGSIGAALGIGAGGSVDIEVDLNMLGDMAKQALTNAADKVLDKLGVKDTIETVGKAINDVKNAVNDVKETVGKATNFVKGLFGFGK